MNETKPSIAAQVAALSSLSQKALWQQWDQYFSSRPSHPNREYLVSRIAYKIQEAAYGGLSEDTRQRLINIGCRYSKIKQRHQVQDIYLAPGTVLMREWDKRPHRVTVTAEGLFEYEGKFFKSLSAVARHISGTRWSGPVFFGLRHAKEKV
jgi:hypothetical protein